MVEELGGLAEVVTRFERSEVGSLHQLAVGELLFDPLDRRLHRTRVHPAHEPEREQVLRAFGVARLDAQLLRALQRHRRHRNLNDAVCSQRIVLERVRLVARLLEVAGLKGVGVHEQRAAGRELADVGAQRGWVHRHQHTGHVARREDLVIRDVHLERRHPGDRAGRRADLGREVRHRREVVAEDRTHVGEAVAGELHAVAGVAGEADDHRVERLGLQVRRVRGHAPLISVSASPLSGRRSRSAVVPMTDSHCRVGVPRNRIQVGSRREPA